jgi:type I restriction enzyme S subunit
MTVANKQPSPKTKHTPAGEIPVEWDCRKLRSVAEIQTGLSMSALRSVEEPVELPYLRVANVQDGHFDLSEVKTVRVSRADFDRYLLQPEDVLLTEGGDFDKLGRGHVWHGDISPCLHQNHVFAVRVDRSKLLPLFLAAFTASPGGRRYFLSCAKQTTNLASINSTQLKALPVPLPPLPEQRKIAEILSTWDRAVEQTEKLIAAKERLKKGLMQRLLTGQLRFPEFEAPPWRTCRLGSLFRERKEAGRDDLPLLSITSDRGLILRDDVDRKDTSNADKSRYKRIAPGDIGYNTMRMWQGVSVLSNLEGIISPAYTVCAPQAEIYGEFAKHLFKFPPMVHLFWRSSQGLVDDTLNLKYHAFSRIKVTIPTVEEQRRIAQVLSAADREILLLRERMSALQQQKKGLMQKLLTGTVRIQAPDNDVKK